MRVVVLALINAPCRMLRLVEAGGRVYGYAPHCLSNSAVNLKLFRNEKLEKKKKILSTSYPRLVISFILSI